MPSTSNNWYEGEKKKCRRNSSATAITSILLFDVVVFLSIGPSACFSEGRLLGHSNVVNLVCRETRYPTRCVSSMMSYPRNQTATLRGLMYLGMRMSMEKAWRAYDMALSLRNKKMKSRERAAWRDCVEHFQATAEHINVCFSRNYNENDIPTWLSAALTRLDTCLNGFRDMKLPVTNPIRILMSSTAVNVSELVSNSLSMYNLHATSKNRRLLSADDQAAFESHYGRVEEDEFPEWLSVGDRRLLQSTSSQANVVVAEDGSGRYRTIGEAVKGAPQQSSKRYVIYVMAGVYRETINIPTSMPNLMFIGDGKDKTVVTGSKNVGISIHNCVVPATPDLQPVVGSVQTYLGRPWKAYSRTVFMLSNLGSLINHAGWLPWSGNFALSTLYYSEYMNTGAGAGTSQRVNWPGFHVLASSSVAAQFTVGQFISGSSWIPATSTPFTAGLN